jgi:hypothetical protein
MGVSMVVRFLLSHLFVHLEEGGDGPQTHRFVHQVRGGDRLIS